MSPRGAPLAISLDSVLGNSWFFFVLTRGQSLRDDGLQIAAAVHLTTLGTAKKEPPLKRSCESTQFKQSVKHSFAKSLRSWRPGTCA